MNEPTGYTALDLIGYTDRGDYDPTATYVKNDLVNSGDTKWRCKIDDTIGITPTEGANWTAFIQLPADTTKQIIAPVEVTPSQHAYQVDEQLIFNSTLYTVTSPIAVNDALVVGTNIEVSPKTVIEQVEDNASDIDDIDAEILAICNVYGSKNLAPFNPRLSPFFNITPTNMGSGTVRYNGTASNVVWFGITQPTTMPSTDTYTTLLPKGTYNVFVKSSQALSSNILVGLFAQTSVEIKLFTSGTDNKYTFTLANDTYVFLGVRFATNASPSNLDIQAWIIDARIKDTSYTDYAMTNKELTQAQSDMYAYSTRNEIALNTNMNNLVKGGRYFCQNTAVASSLTNCPVSVAFGLNVYIGNDSNSFIIQEIDYTANSNEKYMRKYASGSWSSWYKFTGTAV